jgi:ATP phosphoribosyltransferase
MVPQRDPRRVRLALPKGHIQDGVFALLRDAGIEVRIGARAYRPEVSLPDVETKLLRPQSLVEMLHLGSRDVGFAGADWAAELGADLVEVLDTGLDPVRIVAAAPSENVDGNRLKPGRRVVASEYERLARGWIAARDYDAAVLRSYGATEALPPEDADCIVDNTATGATLEANGLIVFDELMTSSTRLYANPRAMDDPFRRGFVERLTLLLRSVLEARRRVMVEVNVPAERLESVIAVLPCMRHPTISTLHGDGGFAVKAAVPRDDLARVIPEIKAQGGSDIVVTRLAQIVP